MLNFVFFAMFIRLALAGPRPCFVQKAPANQSEALALFAVADYRLEVKRKCILVIQSLKIKKGLLVTLAVMFFKTAALLVCAELSSTKGVNIVNQYFV